MEFLGKERSYQERAAAFLRAVTTKRTWLLTKFKVSAQAFDVLEMKHFQTKLDVDGYAERGDFKRADYAIDIMHEIQRIQGAASVVMVRMQGEGDTYDLPSAVEIVRGWAGQQRGSLYHSENEEGGSIAYYFLFERGKKEST